MTTILSQVDPSAEIACTLPINQASDRLDSLQALVGDRLVATERDPNRLRITITRAGHDDLEGEVRAWAQEEKGCCAFLGFAVESRPETVTLEIASPPDAGPTLDAIEWMFRAANRVGAA
jgi:hypothetical protein